MLNDIARIRKMLEITGHWYSYDLKTNEKYFMILQLLRLLFLTVLLIANIYSIYLKGLKESLKGFGVFFPMATMCIICAILIAIKRNNMKRALIKLNNIINNHKEKWEDDILNEDTGILWKTVWIVTLFFIMFFMVYTPIPLVTDAILYNFNIYNGTPINLPQALQGYMDDPPVRNFNYYSLIIISAIWVGLGMLNYLGNITSICVFIVYLKGEMKIIQRKLISLKTINFNKREIYEKKLVEIIKGHLLIKSIVKDVSEVYSSQFVFQNILLPISSSFCFYICVTIENKSLVLYFLLVTQVLLSCAFVCCFAGEMLVEENEKINKLIYNLNWYDYDKHENQIVLLMLGQTSLSMLISYKGLCGMQMTTFQEIFNKTYSYCMLLKTLAVEI